MHNFFRSLSNYSKTQRLAFEPKRSLCGQISTSHKHGKDRKMERIHGGNDVKNQKSGEELGTFI